MSATRRHSRVPGGVRIIPMIVESGSCLFDPSAQVDGSFGEKPGKAGPTWMLPEPTSLESSMLINSEVT
jgi:hypothetical protein